MGSPFTKKMIFELLLSKGAFGNFMMLTFR